MSSSHDAFDKQCDAAIDAVVGRKLPSPVIAASGIAVAWGLIAFLYAIFAGNARWGWGAFLVGMFYVLGIAQGGVAFAALLQVTRAHWGRSLKRVAEAFALFLPVVWLALLFFILFGVDHVYNWSPFFKYGDPVSLVPHSPEVPHSKELWLNRTFFMIREPLTLATLIFFDLWFVINSLRPDLMAAKARLGDKAPAWWDKIIGSATDLQAEITRSNNLNNRIGAGLGWVFALGVTILAFDLIMSLEPWWYANMFGGWIFMSFLWLGMATLGAFTMASRDWLGLGNWVKPKVTHDLGQLILAGTMFWAYTLFAQLLPIYYASIPEEMGFFLVRMSLPEWSWLAQLVAVLCFLTPFTILLSRGLKKLRWPFFALTSLIMVGVFLERTLLVMPAVYLEDTFPVFDFLFVSVGIALGFFGLFVLVVGSVLAQLPAVGITDEFLKGHPWEGHVHAISLEGSARHHG